MFRERGLTWDARTVVVCRSCAVTAGFSRPREGTRLHEDFVPTPWEPVHRPIQRDCTELPFHESMQGSNPGRVMRFSRMEKSLRGDSGALSCDDEGRGSAGQPHIYLPLDEFPLGRAA